MPGPLLHFGATILCSHAGQAQPTTVYPRVLVSGQPTVLQTTPYVVAGCTLPPPPVANGPCVTAQWVTGTTRVFANGVPLLVLSSQAICAPTATPLIPSIAQTRVIAM
ncbi:hypothetical protein IQ274_27780 [Nostoc sp. LEGE 12447]|uniref:hypothetical protein n=1 Tax=Nostoc sp. LEGE 12447 TaxID=1828640 RepID=UPI001684B96D|nr:hypothetical protein [Nostoc sp. LEGE 12447]MBD2511498.1 hypothetical protein [Desmonostoc muscorum FACHB-395]MBE9001898.1 hypothetical protein [Nostoc sp. LEGE 12447]